MPCGIVFLISKLLEKFPGLDILDISQFLGGKWLKNLVGILFLSYFIFTISISLRSFSEELKIIFFSKTDVLIIMMLFLIAIVIVNKLGFSSIARSNLFIMPVVLFTIIFVFFANIENFNFQGMLPIIGKGANATLFAGLSNLFAFSGIGYLYFIPPYLKDEKAQKKIGIISIIGSGICLLIGVATLVFLSPPNIISDEIFPLYLASRYIEFGRFLQRLDAVFLFIWIISLTSYLSISLFFATSLFQKMLNLQYSKWYALLFAMIAFTIGLLPSDMYQIVFIENTVLQYIILILIFAISIGLLVLANFKHNMLNKGKEQF